MVLPVVDAALVGSGRRGGSGGGDAARLEYCNDVDLPRMIVVNRMDRDRADANRVLESLVNAFGRAVTPLQLPIGSEKSFSGLVDLVRMKAYTYEMGGKARQGRSDSGNMATQPRKRTKSWWTLVAEGKDSLMEEFFETGTIPEEHLVSGVARGDSRRQNSSRCCSPPVGECRRGRADGLYVDYTPAASEPSRHHGPGRRRAPNRPTRKGTDNEPASVYVFKTHVGCIRGAHFLFQSFFWGAEERCLAAKLQPEHGRKVCPHFLDSGQAGGSDCGAARGRYRRRWRS